MKIAIIGANSYIARNMIFAFNKKEELYLYDIQENQIDGEDNYKSVNILDPKSVKNIDFNCDLIYIFAGKTGTLAGFSQYETFIDINEKGLLNILDEYLKQKSGAKIIFPSTRLVYKGKEHPLKEDDEKEFKTIYAINKYACEQYLKMYNNMYNIPYCIFRICVPYGTMIENASSYGTAEFMLNKAKNGENITLYGTGEVRRTLTNMKDLTNALILGGISEKFKNDIYNICGEDYSLNGMAKHIAAKYKVNIEYMEYPEDALKTESGSTVFNSDKFDKLSNFKYQNTFADWIGAQ